MFHLRVYERSFRSQLSLFVIRRKGYLEILPLRLRCLVFYTHCFDLLLDSGDKSFYKSTRIFSYHYIRLAIKY